MHRFAGRIADTLLGHRVFAIVTVAVLAVIAGMAATRIKSDFTLEELFTEDGDAKRVHAEFRDHFGNTDNLLALLVEAKDVLSPAPLGYLRDLTADLAVMPWAARSVSITNIALPRRSGRSRRWSDQVTLSAVLGDIAKGDLRLDPVLGEGPVTAESARSLARALGDAPLVRRQLIAEDGTVAVVAVLLSSDYARESQLSSVVTELEAYLAAHPSPPEVRVHLGGLPFMRVDLVRSIGKDQAILFPTAVAIILILLLASFRWAPAVIFPLLVVTMAAAMLVGLMVAVGEPLNIINNIVPVLIIVVGISDSIHLVNRYGEELNRGSSRQAAARAALRKMIAAMFLTSFTTAVGFGSLVVSELPLLVRFGVTAAAGVLIAYAVTIAFLPATLSLAPMPRRRLANRSHGWTERAVGAVVAMVLRRRGAVLMVAVLVAAIAIALARGVEIDTAIHHQYDRESRAFRSIELLEEKLGGVRPVEVALVAAPGRFYAPEVANAVDRATRWARAREGVLAVTSYADLLHESWYVATGDPAARTAPFDSERRLRDLGALLDHGQSTLGRFVVADRSWARISLQLADIGGRATVRLAGELRGILDAELPGDVEYFMTGEGYVSSRGLNLLTRELLASLLLAMVVIFGFLTLVLRSLRLGLLSLPPNLLPLLATLAYLSARGIPLSPGTAIIFSVSIGLAVDGTIHLLARFREELATGVTRDRALLRAARGTGKAVVVSYVSIIIGFSAFQLSGFVPVRQFGELVTVTIAGCLVSTLVLLPALIGLLGPRR